MWLPGVERAWGILVLHNLSRLVVCNGLAVECAVAPSGPCCAEAACSACHSACQPVHLSTESCSSLQSPRRLLGKNKGLAQPRVPRARRHPQLRHPPQRPRTHRVPVRLPSPPGPQGLLSHLQRPGARERRRLLRRPFLRPPLAPPRGCLRRVEVLETGRLRSCHRGQSGLEATYAQHPSKLGQKAVLSRRLDPSHRR